MPQLLDADAAADKFARENSGFSVDASVRTKLIDLDVPSYFQSLEHVLRYCTRLPFALERLSVIRDADGRISRVRTALAVGNGRQQSASSEMPRRVGTMLRIAAAYVQSPAPTTRRAQAWAKLLTGRGNSPPGLFPRADRRAARDRYPQPLTAAGRQVRIKPPGRRTQGASALTPEKRHFSGE
jgi:hypothetical protein